ncbi:FAD binding domain-containing protein [Coccidioides immitis RS]|uniref:Delta(24)-sterol reductase n=1 Tax=Coccidioides immitis (strain RS) TaxID=246410 RepID=J3K2J8_COCIM|nr:FAD binding domain-containing protein [Coccidioides immitis RS]EAS28318.3 FAD binding domain-containing protein [Coccidioides immitis RS]
MEQHKAAVDVVSSTIRGLYSRGLPFRIYHGSTNSTRPQSFQPDRIVDISSFTRILKVDAEKKTVLVEPNVPMDKLVAATLPHGLVPPVVMEFPGITVGGAFAGTGGESSSFRYGFFDRTVTWIEVVLGNGDVVTARPDSGENDDLFWGVSGSFGTIGVTTLLEINLIETSKWVKVGYFPVQSVEEAISVLREKMRDENVDYVDGILFAKDRGVIVTGHMASAVDVERKSSVRTFSRPADEWFYIHAEQLCRESHRERIIEYIPLVDYLFRYDRGGFWVAQFAYEYFYFPFNRFTRWLLDYFMHTRVMYHALHKSRLSSSFIIQDLALPWPAAGDFIHYLNEKFDRYPLWLCPIKPHPQGYASFHPQILPASKSPESQRVVHGVGEEEDTMLLNVGLWTPGPSSHRAFIEANRALEHMVYSLGGAKWLYAQTFYTENEFWTIYDRETYDALRKKYHSSLLPSVYDKVKTDPAASTAAFDRVKYLRPLPGIYGVLRATIGGGYLLPHRKLRVAFGVIMACILGRVLVKWMEA